MLRANSLDRLHQKRTLRGLYIWHQATPYACFLDVASVPAATVVVPGMVASKTTGEQMKVANATEIPFGLFANFIHGSMDELGAGTEIGVYRGGNDATFEVLSGPTTAESPLDSAVTWTTLNLTAGGVALGSNATGQLTNVSPDPVVCRLVEAVSNNKIIVTLDLRTGSFTT